MTSQRLPSDPDKISATSDSPPQGTRRSFFGWVIAATAGFIGLGLGVPLAGYVIAPALNRRAPSWATVGPTGSLRTGEPAELEYASIVKDGWRTVTAKKGIWAVKQPGGEMVVFSPICPHSGCGFRWDTGDRTFKCPCHGSVFDVTGKVLTGPVPRSLNVCLDTDARPASDRARVPPLPESPYNDSVRRGLASSAMP
jgi:menaquinol-cytochrome c reductase iron-sulfur subunit